MSTYNKQVGGSHYKDMAIQPADFINKNNVTIRGRVMLLNIFVDIQATRESYKTIEKAIHYYRNDKGKGL